MFRSPPTSSSGSADPSAETVIEVDVARVLDGEDDPPAVPHRLARERVGRGLPVERGRQQPGVAAVGQHDADLRMVRVRAVLDLVAVRQERAVGRERGRAVGAVLRGDLSRLAAARVDLVQAGDHLHVPAVAAKRAEDDSPAVGSPGRTVVLAVAVGELTLLAVEVDDVEVLPPVADPADAVELEEDAREPARRAPRVVLLVVRLAPRAARRTRSGSSRATRPGPRRPPWRR